MKPEEIVEQGYDRVYKDYQRKRCYWRNVAELSDFAGRLPKNSKVLDVGCGSGYAASFLVRKGLDVTGIDISRNMLGLARQTVPKATFQRMDMLKMRFPAASFEGVACLYSMIHVPRRYHQKILKEFGEVLKPKGLLLITVGAGNYVGTEENWLGRGAKMYWSHFDGETNLKLIKNAGFDIVWSKLIGPTRDEKHLFVLAEKVQTAA